MISVDTRQTPGEHFTVNIVAAVLPIVLIGLSSPETKVSWHTVLVKPTIDRLPHYYFMMMYASIVSQKQRWSNKYSAVMDLSIAKENSTRYYIESSNTS